MRLSAASSAVISLILLTDAVRAEDNQESRRIARQLARIARDNGWPVIARQARAVELLVILDAPTRNVRAAAGRLVLITEQHIHAMPVAEEVSSQLATGVPLSPVAQCRG